MRTQEKKSRWRSYLTVAVVVGSGLALGIKYRASLRRAEAHVHYSIDHHLENSPRLKRVMEVLSYPRRETKKYLRGMSEEELQKQEQEYRDSLDKIVHGNQGETK